MRRRSCIWPTRSPRSLSRSGLSSFGFWDIGVWVNRWVQSMGSVDEFRGGAARNVFGLAQDGRAEGALSTDVEVGLQRRWRQRGVALVQVVQIDLRLPGAYVVGILQDDAAEGVAGVARLVLLEIHLPEEQQHLGLAPGARIFGYDVIKPPD